ncbi:MAG: hypothetical protein MZW92_28355 [Comamonadaceae bacterium]|nr:hypothetical protein [Comamonadaceae bacterium]
MVFDGRAARHAAARAQRAGRRRVDDAAAVRAVAAGRVRAAARPGAGRLRRWSPAPPADAPERPRRASTPPRPASARCAPTIELRQRAARPLGPGPRAAVAARAATCRAVQRTRPQFDLTALRRCGWPPTAASAGRWSGSGAVDGHAAARWTRRWRACGRSAWTARAPAMTLSGPLSLDAGRGLPVAGAPGRAVTAPRLARGAGRATLDGRVDGAPQAVRAGAGRQRPTPARRRPRTATRAPAPRAAKLTLRRPPADGRRLATARPAGTLARLRPACPGGRAPAARPGARGRTGCRAAGTLDLRAAAREPPRAAAGRRWLQRTGRATGRCSVDDSVLAGVPLALDLALEPGRRAAAAAPGARRRWSLGGNRLARRAARAIRPGDGATDRLAARRSTPATLATLAPLARLLPERRGLGADGRQRARPRSRAGRPLAGGMRTEGQAADSQGLQAGRARRRRRPRRAGALDTGGDERSRWNCRPNWPGLRWGRQRARQLRAELRGTWREHRLRADRRAAAGAAAGCRTLARAADDRRARARNCWPHGAWTRPTRPAAGAGADASSGWRVGAWDGSAVAAPVPPPGRLAGRARDLRAELRFGARRQPAASCRPRPAGCAWPTPSTLRWDEVRVDLRGARAAIRAARRRRALRAGAAAGARCSPTMGWQRRPARWRRASTSRAGERFDADIVFERRDGDLRSDRRERHAVAAA